MIAVCTSPHATSTNERGGEDKDAEEEEDDDESESDKRKEEMREGEFFWDVLPRPS